MRQSDSVSEELDTENVQCALDFENTMNELETQLYYRHLPPKEVALRVMEAACKFYDADWCGLIQVDLDLGLWKPLWWHNECQEDKTTILTNEFESSEFLDRWVKAVRRGTPTEQHQQLFRIFQCGHSLSDGGHSQQQANLPARALSAGHPA